MATQRITWNGQILEVPLDDTTIHCPVCGSDDVGQWADDGESDAADYWDCAVCKANGDMLAPEGFVTQNGLPPQDSWPRDSVVVREP